MSDHLDRNELILHYIVFRDRERTLTTAQSEEETRKIPSDGERPGREERTVGESLRERFRRGKRGHHEREALMAVFYKPA